MSESVNEKRLNLADRLALRPKEVAEALGLSERTVREIMPELPKIRVGKALLVPIDCLRDWLRDQAKTEQGRARRMAPRSGPEALSQGRGEYHVGRRGAPDRASSRDR